MPERTETVLGELSLTEFALLEFTNDGVVERPEYKPFIAKEPLVLTTKASYLWPATLSVMVADDPSIESDRIINAYRASLRRSAEELHAYYARYAAHMGYHLGHEEAHLYNIHDEFCGQLGFANRQNVIRRAQLSAERSYKSLLQAGLIEDPIFTTVFGWSLAVVGFIPYGFTTKTRRGRTVHRRIVALLWEYEQTLQGGERTTRLEFKLWKILRAFKKALAEEMEDHIEGHGEGHERPG